MSSGIGELVTQNSMLRFLTGIEVNAERSAVLFPMLQKYMADINMLQQVDTTGIQPELPLRWEVYGL